MIYRCKMIAINKMCQQQRNHFLKCLLNERFIFTENSKKARNRPIDPEEEQLWLNDSLELTECTKEISIIWFFFSFWKCLLLHSPTEWSSALVLISLLSKLFPKVYLKESVMANKRKDTTSTNNAWKRTFRMPNMFSVMPEVCSNKRYSENELYYAAITIVYSRQYNHI